jgi:hypothetical protein
MKSVFAPVCNWLSHVLREDPFSWFGFGGQYRARDL